MDYLKDLTLHFEIPPNPEFGDLSCNAALLLSKKLKMNPRTLAEEIIRNLEIDNSVVVETRIAGPGFINFFFSPGYVNNIIKEIIDRGDQYGKSDKFAGKIANVEFVSANPTGPLTVGHGRNAVCGDTIANLLEWVGYKVDREYYFNNDSPFSLILRFDSYKRFGNTFTVIKEKYITGGICYSPIEAYKFSLDWKNCSDYTQSHNEIYLTAGFNF